MQSIPRRSLFNYIGLAILIAGMASGELLYWHGLHQDSAADYDGESPYDSRVYEQTVERTIGVFGLIMDEFSRGLATLREPKPLGITIGIVSMLAAGGCFLVASNMPAE